MWHTTHYAHQNHVSKANDICGIQHTMHIRTMSVWPMAYVAYNTLCTSEPCQQGQWHRWHTTHYAHQNHVSKANGTCTLDEVSGKNSCSTQTTVTEHTAKNRSYILCMYVHIDIRHTHILHSLLLKLSELNTIHTLCITTCQQLTWNCVTCGLLHLAAGISSTFIICMECDRARWRAAMSR
jgi:hypothetical protein